MQQYHILMIGVAINGYGTIGRRVAYGVSMQDDMYVTGIVKNSPTRLP
jgi:glyceraldehyde-3-phosphate dehydrogenase (NAD(P))